MRAMAVAGLLATMAFGCRDADRSRARWRPSPRAPATLTAPRSPIPVPDGDPKRGRRLVARIGPDHPVKVGDQVRLAMDLGRIHLFDGQSGVALRPSPSSVI